METARDEIGITQMTDEELDHSPMGKGQYRDRTPSQVAEDDPSYLVWAYKTWAKKPCSAVLFRECQKDVDAGTRQDRVSRDQDDGG